jgi:hypothetical protein
MKTKLEMMVAYLSGRQGEAAGSIRQELADPSSEASRWLEALRSRSGAIFGAGLPEMSDLVPTRPIRGRKTGRASTTPATAGRRLPLLLGASSAALVVLVLGASWRSQDVRLRHLEAALSRRDARWGDRFDRLEAALVRREAPPKRELPSPKAAIPREVKPTTPGDQPTHLALARIEARLGELGQRLEQAGRDQADPRVAEVRQDLDRIRRDVEAAGRASRQESQELGAAVQEILELLRRLASQSVSMQTMPIPVPVPVSPQGLQPRVGQDGGMIPGQGPAQMPGTSHLQFAPGRGNR